MTVLILGRTGQLGRALNRTLTDRLESKIIALGRAELDLAQPDKIAAAIKHYRPSVVVNAAAYTQVDQAETDTELAMCVNGEAPSVLAEVCAATGAWLIHYSTDYVFDGEQTQGYLEQDLTNPINAYGRSKLAGELGVLAGQADHLVLRTSWVYSLEGANFLNTMARLMASERQLRVVADQVGTPTWTGFLAQATAELVIERLVHGVSLGGLYHLVPNGKTSWHGFASAILQGLRDAAQSVVTEEIVPITSAEYPTPAARPKCSVLDNRKLARATASELPDWQDGLQACLRSN